MCVYVWRGGGIAEYRAEGVYRKIFLHLKGPCKYKETINTLSPHLMILQEIVFGMKI
jgi:hypothetical protein